MSSQTLTLTRGVTYKRRRNNTSNKLMSYIMLTFVIIEIMMVSAPSIMANAPEASATTSNHNTTTKMQQRAM